MSGKCVPIEKNLAHYAGVFYCSACGFREIGVVPVTQGGVDTECGGCGEMTASLVEIGRVARGQFCWGG